MVRRGAPGGKGQPRASSRLCAAAARAYLRPMRIQYLDGVRLRRALVAGCEYVQTQRVELNRINVFPVPDGDTGTNLALTAAAIAERMRASRARSVSVVARDAADAAILGARGNCGMILSHFLLGFADATGTRSRLKAEDFATSLEHATSHVYRALERPVEGTIITVMREISTEATSREPADFADLAERMLTRGRDALARTPDLLPALKAAGVVDAGAKGFVHMFEGIVGFVHGDPLMELAEDGAFEPMAPALAAYPTESERYRFCTEALVRGDALPDADTVRAQFRDRGDSMIVIRGDGVLKIHIHTDEPEAVFAWLKGVGTLATHKAEDMRAQHAAVERAAAAHVQLARRPISIVTDSSCDLPQEIIAAHGIHVVPLSLLLDSGVLRDRIDITADQFVERLRAGEHPTTSQPPPAAFLEAFRRAAEDGESILAVLLGKGLSGTFGSAEAAAKQVPELPVTMVDSGSASLSLGLLVLLGSELGERGMPPADIARELVRVRAQSGVFFTIDVFDNLLASGRVGRGQVMLADIFDIKPILGIEPPGKVVPLAKVRGTRNALPRMMELLAAKVPADADKLRFGIVHVGYPEVVAGVRAELEKRFGERETIVAPASPVLATHLGVKAWGLVYQWED
jgi:uncharacterized protein